MHPAFLVPLFWIAAMAAPPQSEFIFDSAPFPSCHASTLVELKDGSLMAAWFGGKDEGARDVAIWGAVKRSGEAWSKPVELAREADTPTWNPVLFHTADGKLWLYYKFGPSPQTWTAARMSSGDEGRTWSQPEHLPAGLLGPIRSKPLVLPDGAIVAGSSVESYQSWAVWIERSADNGKTWSKIGPIVVPPGVARLPGAEHKTDGIIQPSVVSLGADRLLLVARSTGTLGRVVVSTSNDAGRSWTSARPIDLPNPNSGIDAVTLKDGRLVLIYNHTGSGRSPLNLAVSRDGENWKMFATLESAPGEFSYPAIIQAASGDLEITYTWNRTRIRHIRIPLSDVPKPD